MTHLLRPRLAPLFLVPFVFVQTSWLAAADFEDMLPLLPDSGVINVKDFGAKGDGVTDDLIAIRKAVEKALDRESRYSSPPFIYFPAGTYLISDTIEARIDKSWSAGWRSGFQVMGEARSRVIIQLADGASGFADPENPKPVFVTGSESDKPRPEGWGNRAFRHNIFNLTIDTGKNNPGAVGIDFLTNNRGAVRNVTIRSGDPNGAGAIGIDMSRQWPGPGLIKNVRIEGFDTGIRMDRHGQYSMTFDGITLRGQRKVGIFNKQNGAFIEQLDFEGDVPAIQQTEKNGMTILVDSQLRGGGSGQAIENPEGGVVILKNVEVAGFKSVSDAADSSIQDPQPGLISHWCSHPAIDNGKGADLASKPSPEVVLADPAQWQNAAEFIVEGEDPTAAIQRALDVGKPGVYFPNGGYQVTRTLVVPPSVRRITGMQSALSADREVLAGNHLLKISGGSDPLVIEHLWFSKGTEKGTPSSENLVVVQDSGRPVVIRHSEIHGGYENTARGNGDVFFEDIMGTPIRIHHPQSAWGRQVNCEFLSDEPMLQSRGGTVWMLGYKTEGQQIIFDGKGGKAELLGVFAYALGKQGKNYDDLPMLRLDGTKASLSIMGNGNRWTTVIEDGSKTITAKDLRGRGRASMLPLYQN